MDNLFIYALIAAIVIIMAIRIKPVTVEEWLKDDPSKDGGGDMR